MAPSASRQQPSGVAPSGRSAQIRRFDKAIDGRVVGTTSNYMEFNRLEIDRAVLAGNRSHGRLVGHLDRLRLHRSLLPTQTTTFPCTFLPDNPINRNL